MSLAIVVTTEGQHLDEVAEAIERKAGEAAAALAVLGYGSQEISTALKGIDMDALPLEEIIRQALKKMVR